MCIRDRKGSTLDINNRFIGGIEAHDSKVNVTSPDALLQNSVDIFVSGLLDLVSNIISSTQRIFKEANL